MKIPKLPRYHPWAILPKNDGSVLRDESRTDIAFDNSMPRYVTIRSRCYYLPRELRSNLLISLLGKIDTPRLNPRQARLDQYTEVLLNYHKLLFMVIPFLKLRSVSNNSKSNISRSIGIHLSLMRPNEQPQNQYSEDVLIPVILTIGR